MNQYKPFRGKLKLIRLKSIILGFFMPITGKEVEQHLTIRNDGRVWLNRYGFSYPVNPFYEKRKSEYYKISKESVDKIFELITSLFNNYFDVPLACDAGLWEAVLVNTEGEVFYYHGNLFGDYKVNNIDICKLIRDELNLPDLLLFDGKAREEFVSTIDATFNIDNSKEKLYLDYKECELRLSLEKNEENTTLTIKRPNKIKAFLEKFEFKEWVYHPDDSKRKNNRRYQISITSNKGNVLTYEGSYDSIGLPSCWVALVTFIEEIVSIKDFNFLKSKIFLKEYPKEDEIIYCSVSFGSSLSKLRDMSRQYQ